MADITYEGLPTGLPADTDIIPSQVPGGQTQGYTLADVGTHNRALAEAHSDADYTMLGVTATPEKLNGYDASLTSVGITTTLIPTAGSNTSSFTIDKAGIYRVTLSIEVESTTNESIDFIINVDGVPTPFKTGVDLRNNVIDRGSAGVNTFMSFTVGQVIETYINTDGGNMDILIDSLTMTIKKE